MGWAWRREQWAVAWLSVAVLGAALMGAAGAFEEGTAVYIVTMKQAPVFHKRLDLERFGSSRVAGGGGGGGGDTPSTSILMKPRFLMVYYSSMIWFCSIFTVYAKYVCTIQFG
jgi:hypothetical protein